MAPELEAKLKRIFFGDVPEFMSVLDGEVVRKAFARQNITLLRKGLPDLSKLNMVQLIQDLGELYSKTDLKVLTEKDRPVLSEEFRAKAGTAVRSVFYEYVQTQNISAEDKLRLIIFLRDFLELLTKIYNQDYIENQLSFFKELFSLQHQYMLEVKKLKQPIAVVPPATKPTRKITPFKSGLSESAQSKLITFLRNSKWVDNPIPFVNFLIGKDSGENINIAPEAEYSICYLIHLLYKDGFIRMQSGGGYIDYVQSTLRFSKKRNDNFVKNTLSKIQRSKTRKSAIEKDLGSLIKDLK